MIPRIKIQSEDFDVGAEIGALAAGGADMDASHPGAIVSFTGYVRAQNGVTALTLEHYPAMTHAEIARIVAEAASRWPLLGVSIVHRTGRLLPDMRIVLVAVASAHRGAAFEACEFLMDYLKTEAPFWKLEERGETQVWIEAKTLDDARMARWRK